MSERMVTRREMERIRPGLGGYIHQDPNTIPVVTMQLEGVVSLYDTLLRAVELLKCVQSDRSVGHLNDDTQDIVARFLAEFER